MRLEFYWVGAQDALFGARHPFQFPRGMPVVRLLCSSAIPVQEQMLPAEPRRCRNLSPLAVPRFLTRRRQEAWN
jgi:hypothetical protein